MGDGTAEKKFAIMKAINYKDSSFEKIQRHVDYILDPKKSPREYRQGWYVGWNEALQGLESLYKRYHPKGTRNFKHWIISFGDPMLSPDKAFEVSKNIADYYGRDYPVVLGLHTNTRRVHCHFLQNTVAIRSGRKFSQSLDDFDDFRFFVNDVLKHYKLPLLRGLLKQESSLGDLYHEKEVDTGTYDDEYYPIVPYYQVMQGTPVLDYQVVQETISPREATYTANIQLQGVVDMAECLKVFTDGIIKFHEYGKGSR